MGSKASVSTASSSQSLLIGCGKKGCEGCGDEQRTLLTKWKFGNSFAIIDLQLSDSANKKE